jgi:hypothetical protein
MTWDALASIAEVVSAIAVVATLLFLAIELRNNRSATQIAAVDALSTGFNSCNFKIIEDGEFAEIWMKGLTDPESLDNVARVRFATYVQSTINQYTSMKRYHDSGVLPDNEWRIYYIGVASIMYSPGGRWIGEELAVTSEVMAEIGKYENKTAAYKWMGRG